MNWDFYENYPDNVNVYRLHNLDFSEVWKVLKIQRPYPESKYIPNPNVTEIETAVDNSQLQELFNTRIYILGKPGSGKTVASIHLVKVIEKKLRGRFSAIPFPWCPKLVVTNPQILHTKNNSVSLRMFKESVIFVVDDFQDLRQEVQQSIRYVLNDFTSGNRQGVAICSSRRHPHHASPFTGEVQVLDCSNFSTQGYQTFLEMLTKQCAEGTGVESKVDYTIDAIEKLVQSAIEHRQPPLYIVCLFRFLLETKNENKLTIQSLEHIPKELDNIYDKSGEKLNSNQQYLLICIKIIKEVKSLVDKKLVECLYTCLFERYDFDVELMSFDYSIWFSEQDKFLLIVDSPFDWIKFENLQSRLEDIVNLVTEEKESQKGDCIRKYDDIHSFLGALGLIFWLWDPSWSEKCYRYLLIQESISDILHLIALVNLGILLSDTGRMDEAEKYFRMAIEVAPEDVSVLYNLGVLLVKAGRMKEAEEQYRKVLGIDPEHVDALSSLGLLLSDTDRIVETEELYRKALDRVPQHERTLYNLGDLLHEMGKYKEAEEQYRKALELDPEHIGALNNLRLLLFNVGRIVESCDVLHETLSRVDIDSDVISVILEMIRRFCG